MVPPRCCRSLTRTSSSDAIAAGAVSLFLGRKGIRLVCCGLGRRWCLPQFGPHEKY
jgi:hypothetical protein